MAKKGQYTELDSRDIVSEFFPAFEAGIEAGFADDLVMVMDSDSETENYKWPGAAPGLREWKGGRHEEVLSKFSFSITNNKYEDTLPIALDDLRRDKTGFLRRRVQEMAQKAALHPDVLLTSLIEANDNAYDGNPFFAASGNPHDEYSGEDQINDLTSTEIGALNVSDADAPTPEELAEVLVESVGHFYTFKDDKGDPINGGVRNFVIMSGTANYWSAISKAIKAAFLASGESNIVTDMGVTFRNVLNPRLATASGQASYRKFYMFSTDGVMRPFILQEEVPLTTQLLGAGSDYEFDNDAHKFGLKVVRNVGNARWQLAQRLTLS